jgi:ferrous iron transport protein B
VAFGGASIRLIDLPGTYAISSHDLAEKVARDFLLEGRADVIINVVDASMLSRSVELTLQLIEMNVPMVVALNMVDEAEHKGITVDAAYLAELTGVAACPVVAVQGRGIDELFRGALACAREPYRPVKPVYDRDVEECIARIRAAMSDAVKAAFAMDQRFVVLRLLEMDEEFEARTGAADPAFLALVREERRMLAELHDWPETSVFASHRHAAVLDLYEKVATLRHHERTGLREHLDQFITNPIGGLLTVVGSLFLLFATSFWLGDVIAALLETPAGWAREAVARTGEGLLPALLLGLVEGVVAGAGIVVPYLIPLLVLLALYEDTGFLPRMAFMVDGLLHRVGLHGRSVVPLVLGYGCNVPAIMATRNLESRRERLLAALVVPFIPCSARTVVILALAGKFLGAAWTTAIYLGSGAIALGVSWVLSRFDVDTAPGIIMDVPPLRRPYLHVVLSKVWVRSYEFLAFAWPVVVGASVVLAILDHVGVNEPINAALAPLTVNLLHLPAATGIALFLGLFRKELALLMLTTALGTADMSTVLSNQQILVLVVFTTLYIPCLAVLTMLWKEGGWRTSLLSAGLNLGVALAVAGAVAQLPF